MRFSFRWTPNIGSCLPPLSRCHIHNIAERRRSHCLRVPRAITVRGKSWTVICGTCVRTYSTTVLCGTCVRIYSTPGLCLPPSSVCTIPGSLDLQWICGRLVCRHTPLSRANNNALYIPPYPPPYPQITATAVPIPADADLTEEVAFFQVRARIHSLLRTSCNALYSDGRGDNCISNLSCISSRCAHKSAYTRAQCLSSRHSISFFTQQTIPQDATCMRYIISADIACTHVNVHA